MQESLAHFLQSSHPDHTHPTALPLLPPRPAPRPTPAGQKLPTLNDDQTITVTKSGSSVAFVPSASGAPRANVVQADIKACQAIIHVIDQVGEWGGLSGASLCKAPGLVAHFANSTCPQHER